MSLTDNRIAQITGDYFAPSEFLDGRENLSVVIIEEMADWRIWHGFKVQITSGFRDTGSHTTGKALDCLLWKEWKQSQPEPMHLWRLATTWPFLGVGIYFDWNDGVGLHVDVIRTERQRPLRWMRIDGEYWYQDVTTGLFYHEYDSISLKQAIQQWNRN